jgi:hypothetical protein
VIGLGNAGRLKVERDVYYDIRGTLEWGGLYYYLGEDWYGKTITYKSVTSQMFPITVEELRPGYIKGSERSITMHSGVYGWHGDPDLHMGYRYDGRGALAPSGFLTTVDRSGVRTDIALQENETAVLKKIPVTLDAQRPVNLVVVRYDDAGIQLILNGKGEVGCRVRDGDFAVKPGDAYVTKADGLTRVTADERGGLSFRIILDGHLELGIERAEGK